MKDAPAIAGVVFLSSVLAVLMPAGMRVFSAAPPPVAAEPVAAMSPPGAAREAGGLLSFVKQATGVDLDAQHLRGAIDVVLATVPDPENSPLSLLTDEAIDAISGSAVRAGYLVDAHHLPWTRRESAKSTPAPGKDGVRTFDAQIDSSTLSARLNVKVTAEDEKGVGALLFRREAAGREAQWLLVLLVAESPVTGVSTAPLDIALSLAGCGHAGATLRLLGPSFTGSAHRLWRILNDCASAANIVSGSATGKITEADLGARKRFGRTVLPDLEMLTFLTEQLQRPNAADDLYVSAKEGK